MNAVLITIGDEILSGTTTDTNSGYIAGRLKSIGIKVLKIITVSDEIAAIKSALSEGFSLSSLIICTGGLGPTADDKTKKAFAEFFDRKLIHDEGIFQHLKNILEERNRGHLLEINRGQAEVPEKSIIFQNFFGTAPSILLEKENKTAICLPGVPYEVKPIIKNQILPYLAEKFGGQFLISKTITVVNFPESLLSEKLNDWEKNLPENVSLSYLPVSGAVKLKMTVETTDRTDAEKILSDSTDALRPRITDHIVSESAESHSEIAAELLLKNNLTISVAESCTGGQLARLLVSVPGSSRYFKGGLVAYSDQIKKNILGVSAELISLETAVSGNVAREMAEGCRKMFGTDVSIGVTGVAGPGEDYLGNPQGLAYYCINIGGEEKVFRRFLPHLEREDFMVLVSLNIIQDLSAMLIL